MKVQVRFRVWVFIESFSLRMSRHLGSLHQSLPQTKRSQWSLTIEQRTSLMWSCTAPDSPCLQAVYWKCSGKRIGIQCLRLLPAANFLRPGIWQPVPGWNCGGVIGGNDWTPLPFRLSLLRWVLICSCWYLLIVIPVFEEPCGICL